MNMARIKKIIRCEKQEKDGYECLKVWVQLDTGSELYLAYIGGDVETFHHNGSNRFFVKKTKDLTVRIVK